jgi:hypothetical protein
MWIVLPRTFPLARRISKEIDDLKERVLRLAFIHTDILFEVFDTIG